MKTDLISIYKTKNDYYKLTNEYLNKIDCNDLEIDFDNISPKSIAILIDHDFIPTPCIQIKLELHKDQKMIGSYFLYIDENKEFIDEFLVF